MPECCFIAVPACADRHRARRRRHGGDGRARTSATKPARSGSASQRGVMARSTPRRRCTSSRSNGSCGSAGFSPLPVTIKTRRKPRAAAPRIKVARARCATVRSCRADRCAHPAPSAPRCSRSLVRPSTPVGLATKGSGAATGMVRRLRLQLGLGRARLDRAGGLGLFESAAASFSAASNSARSSSVGSRWRLMGGLRKIACRHPAAPPPASASSTNNWPWAFMRPAMACAFAPKPQNTSPRTGPRMAPPVSWAIRSRSNGAVGPGRIGIRRGGRHEERRAQRMQPEIDGQAGARRQRHAFAAVRAERRIGQRRLAEEDIGAVGLHHPARPDRDAPSARRGSIAARPFRAGSRLRRSACGRWRYRAGRSGPHRRPAPWLPSSNATRPEPWMWRKNTAIGSSRIEQDRGGLEPVRVDGAPGPDRAPALWPSSRPAMFSWAHWGRNWPRSTRDQIVRHAIDRRLVGAVAGAAGPDLGLVIAGEEPVARPRRRRWRQAGTSVSKKRFGARAPA